MDVVRSIYGVLGQFGGNRGSSPKPVQSSDQSEKQFPDPVVFDRNGDNRLDALDVVYTNAVKRRKFSEATTEKEAAAKEAVVKEIELKPSPISKPLPKPYAEETPKPTSDSVKEEPKPVLSLTV